MKIAVVGTGIIGKSHLNAIYTSSECALCAVCDVNETVAKQYSQQYGVPYFTDYREIPQKTDAEAVILNLPHWLHCETAVFFLSHGIHVLVEKPMANSLRECEIMLAEAHKSGKILAVGHPQRFVEANRMVKRIVQSGELGKLCMVNEIRTIDYFLPNRPKWFLDKKLAGGGIVMNYGAHALDKLFYILESYPTSVKAVTGNVKNDHTIEGHAQIMLAFENGISANITFSGYSNAGYETVYYFTDGALKVTDTSNLWMRTNGDWERVELTENTDRTGFQLQEFCKLIRGEDSEMPDGLYGKEIIAVIEKIYGHKAEE